MGATAFSLRSMTATALMTAILCILSPLALPLPFSPVPITLGSFSIYLAVYILGRKGGLLCYTLYFLLGIAGLPVFSGFGSGPGVILGPTGGYLIGFFFLVGIEGFFMGKKRTMALLGMILGTLVCYLFGSLWLAYFLHISFPAALAAGVLPYLAGDAVKITAAAWLGTAVNKRIGSQLDML